LTGCIKSRRPGAHWSVAPTFGRTSSNRRGARLAEALVLGKAIAVQGGHYNMATTTNMRHFECADCGHRWEAPFGTAAPPLVRNAKARISAAPRKNAATGRCARQGRGQGMAQSSGEGAGPGTGQGRTRRRRIRACAQGGKDQAKNASES
jgi:hypothetical protein